MPAGVLRGDRKLTIRREFSASKTRCRHGVPKSIFENEERAGRRGVIEKVG